MQVRLHEDPAQEEELLQPDKLLDDRQDRRLKLEFTPSDAATEASDATATEAVVVDETEV